MGRAPCCEKLGLKRGPWSSEEDQLLIAYIHEYGHGNWRALPKLAGLLRCGKSCRLRWTNYLRPDIKRGNFTPEEEEAIFQLHHTLGNRWSTIAAKLPGRTDNEIKNVWHTHLKKKLIQSTPDTEPHLIKSEGSLKKDSKSKSKSTSRSKPRSKAKAKPQTKTEPESKNPSTPDNTENPCSNAPLSPQPCSSEPSSVVESGTMSEYIPQNNNIMEDEYMESWAALPQTNEILWSDFMPEQFNIMDELSTMETNPEVQLPASSLSTQSSINNDGVDFWYELFAQSHALLDIPDF